MAVFDLRKDPIKAVQTAMVLAEQAHYDQLDKLGEPYYWHVLRVGLSGETPEEKIVGLLHDTIEDSNLLELETILNFFGAACADAVESVTRRYDEPYRDFILRAKQNPLGRSRKIADVRDHLSRIHRLDPQSRTRLEPRYLSALHVLEYP